MLKYPKICPILPQFQGGKSYIVTLLLIEVSDKTCLKWNNFQENVNAAFGNLGEDNECDPGL